MFIKNISKPIDAPAITFSWEYIDIKSGQVVEQQTSRDFNLIIPNAQKNYQKKIRLNAIDITTRQIVGRDSATLFINCRKPPQVGDISISDTLLVPLQPLVFEVATDDNPSLTYQWEFGDGSQEFEAKPTHVYQQGGYYQLKVRVRDTLQTEGICERHVQTEIEIQGEKKQTYLPLPIFNLLKEPPIITNPVKNWALFLLIVLISITLWAWRKWWHRPFPEIIPKNNFVEANPPKIIDLLKEQIQPTALQLSITNQLRLRENGLQQTVDIIPTVHRTIEKGAFPHVQFKYKTQPTEYLVLLPQETEKHISTQLFNYLISFFQAQDVLLTTFYYKGNWEKVWNADNPKGIVLEKLNRQFPQHRLLLYLPKMTNDVEVELVQNNLVKNKTLLDWSKKAALQAPASLSIQSNLINIFPTTLSGFQAAITYLNRAEKDSIIRVGDDLKTTLKNWQSLTDYKQHLLHKPDIFRWFKALVIHPRPTIHSMIAVGQALQLPLAYDTLLSLSSLPYFQEGKFNRILWQSLWSSLSKTEERKVRKGVKEALLAQVTASTEKVDNSLNKLIAIQNFGIDPTLQDNQEAVRYLLKNRQFSDLQLEELDLIITRHIDNYRPGQAIGETIANYLADLPEAKPTENRPWSTQFFWLALIFTLLSLTWGGILTLLPNGIHRDTIEQLKHEAAKWNNQAVDQYLSAQADSIVDAISTKNYQGFSKISENTAYYLHKAKMADTTFEKAINNFQKLRYNDGVAYYEQFFKQRGDQLNLAKDQFNTILKDSLALQDSTRLATLLALAKIYDLLNEPDSVCKIINAMKSEENLDFLEHNNFLVEQANYCAMNPTKIYIKGQVVNASNNQPLPKVVISGANFSTLSNKNGIFQGAIILPKTENRLSLNFRLATYQSTRQNFIINSDTLQLRTVNLKLQLPKQVQVPRDFTKNQTTRLTTSEFPIPEMTIVPGGQFIMGCTDLPADHCKPNEAPAHEVFLDSFEIGVYEVTNEQFAAFLNDSKEKVITEGINQGKPLTYPTPQGLQQKEGNTWQPSKGYDKHPVIAVSRASAVAYCRWLSKKTGQVWRLPTEAEWEYAAKGGQKGKDNKYLYSGGNNLEEVAWCYSNSAQKGQQHPDYGTHPVGQKKPNALGIYDMSGNVFEWCLDWYRLDFYEQTTGEKAINPVCQQSSERRILRGGSWYFYNEFDCRIANRFAVKYPSGGIETGFRCVRVLKGLN